MKACWSNPEIHHPEVLYTTGGDQGGQAIANQELY